MEGSFFSEWLGFSTQNSPNVVSCLTKMAAILFSDSRARLSPKLVEKSHSCLAKQLSQKAKKALGLVDRVALSVYPKVSPVRVSVQSPLRLTRKQRKTKGARLPSTLAVIEVANFRINIKKI